MGAHNVVVALGFSKFVGTLGGVIAYPSSIKDIA